MIKHFFQKSMGKLPRFLSHYPLSRRTKVLCDYLRLFKKKGITTDEYYQFKMDKQSETFRRDFLGCNEQRFYFDLLNPIKNYILSLDKFVAHRMLEKNGVKMPELYCYYNPEALYQENDECASGVSDVCRILKEKNVSSCIVKATDSSHGKGVWVVDEIQYQEDDALLTRYDGKQMLLSSVLQDVPLIFEAVVQQSRQFSSFNSSSVNTVRFMTTLYPGGEARIIATWMRFGRDGSCVDNAGNGGNVDAAVDTETGVIQFPVQFDGYENVVEIERHPDSGAQLSGVRIEDWDNIRKAVIKWQLAVPHCKAAAWDVAITEDGPVVIEINDFFDRIGQMFIHRGWRNEIRDCYMAWKKLGKDYSMARRPSRLKPKHLKRIAQI